MPAQLQCSRSGAWEPGNEAKKQVSYPGSRLVPRLSCMDGEPGNEAVECKSLDARLMSLRTSSDDDSASSVQRVVYWRGVSRL